MRFLLNLSASAGQGPSRLLCINYQYPLSAAIYKIIQRADEQFAAFLHDTGYGGGNKSFKLFTFSDIRTPFQIMGDRLKLLGTEAELIICFHIPQAAENFIRGLFMHQQLEIADNRSKVEFDIRQITALPVINTPGQLQPTGLQEVLLSPLSPVVCGRKNDKGNYDYLAPEDPAFPRWLLHNWEEKYVALHGPEAAEQTFQQVQLRVLPSRQPAKPRLITIKANTPAETKIKGYVKFQLEVKAPADALELILNAGIGIHNAQGMGCVGIG